MIKKIFITMLIILLLVNPILAGVQFFQTKTNLGNRTIQNRILFCYDKEMSAVLPDIKDYISGNNFYQAYILYSMYPRKWNIDNPDYKIDYCNISFQQSTRLTNYTILDFRHLTSNDYDLSNIKYFYQLSDGDCSVVEQRCVYKINSNISDLDIPAEMQFVSPTFECKSCQYFENSRLEASVLKSNIINSNTITISGFIKRLVGLNFEILLMVFWTFLIIMLYVGLGFIFLGVYFLYKYLEMLSKK